MYNIYDDYNDATYSSAPSQRDADPSIAWKTALAFPGAEKCCCTHTGLMLLIFLERCFARAFSGFMGK